MCFSVGPAGGVGEGRYGSDHVQQQVGRRPTIAFAKFCVCPHPVVHFTPAPSVPYLSRPFGSDHV